MSIGKTSLEEGSKETGRKSTDSLADPLKSSLNDSLQDSRRDSPANPLPIPANSDVPPSALARLIENPLIGYFVVDVVERPHDETSEQTFVYSFINNRYKQLLGLRDQDLLGTTAFDHLSEQDCLVMQSNFERCAHLARPLTYDEVLFLDKGRLWWQVHLVPELDGTGKVVRLVGSVSDLTDQRRIENALLEAERKNRALISSMPDAIFKISREGVFLDLEEGKDTVLGLPPIEFLGRHMSEALPEEMAELAKTHIQRAIQYRRTQVFEYQLDIGNTPHDFEVRVVAINSEEVLAIVRDISEKKQVERDLVVAKEEAEAANKAKSAFLATVSHELRTPLNAILGFSDVIRNQLFGSIGSAKYIDYASDIYTSGAHLLEIISDIIDLSKLESSTAELEEEVFDINTNIDAAIRVFATQFEEAGLTLERKFAEGLPMLEADRRAFRQIVINLLSNAIKFTKPGGRVTVESRREISGAVTIIVSDTGIGIEKTDIPRALAPFEQIECAMRRYYEGTGLGLPLVKSLTELHDGTLEIKSRKNVGTAVIIRFPLKRSILESQNDNTIHASRDDLADGGPHQPKKISIS